MKVIDLLNKIANGEEVPENIVFQGEQYGLEKAGGVYNYCYGDEYNNTRWLFDDRYDTTTILNKEVEILDEEDEFIDIKELTTEPHHYIENTINQLIKNQKKIIDKLKKEGK